MNTSCAPRACFYFQVHQPERLKNLSIADIKNGTLDLFDDDKNDAIFRKVAEKCYLPANATILHILRTNPDAHFAYSLSGIFLKQCERFGQDVLHSFRALAETGRIEFLAETAMHSLSSLTSTAEFCAQVKEHGELLHRLLGVRPRVLRNTELIFSNGVAEVVRQLGFAGMLAEGVPRLLNGRSPTQIYRPQPSMLSQGQWDATTPYRADASVRDALPILLKHYQLSDDIAFRFGDSHRSATPLTAPTFAHWVKSAGGHSVNLFMDYETFGEHQWSDTGIFDFLAALPHALQEQGIVMATPSQVLRAWEGNGARADIYDAHEPVSWADIERDVSAWLGNPLQDGAHAAVYALEAAVRERNDAAITEAWKKLLTSDHFYYMCTKYWSDGDVHKYFSPYQSPYEAYRRFSNALCALRACLLPANS